MTKEQLKDKTKQFAVKIVELVNELPNTVSGRSVANNLANCGTAVGAKYRVACRTSSETKTDEEYIEKLEFVVDEIDETCFWIELIIDSKLLLNEKPKFLLEEAEKLNEILKSISET